MFAVTRRFTGFLLVVLGAWAGIVPFVGPLFGYRMDPTPAWTWTTAHWELNAAPGALVVLAGLFLLLGRRASAVLGGWLAMIGGAWLVVGPLFASLWLHHDGQTRIASATLMSAMRPLGYHYGTGLVIVALGAWMIGRRVLLNAPAGEGYAPMGRGRRHERVVAEPVEATGSTSNATADGTIAR